MPHRIAFALLLASGACTTTDSSPEPHLAPMDPGSSVLSGTVNGQPWAFQVGGIDSRLPDGSLVAFLFAEGSEPCPHVTPRPGLLLVIPPQRGDYVLDLSEAMVKFLGSWPPGRPNSIHWIWPFATAGTLTIDTVSETQVTGAMRASFDGDNEVDGTFELTVCPGA